MIIEWIINAIITVIKLPFYLINIPSVDVSGMLNKIMPYLVDGIVFVRFFFDDFAITIIMLALTVIAIFKVVDIISTIVGFFKKTGGSKE